MFALGKRTPPAIRAYLDAYPEAASALARLVDRAREAGFVEWDIIATETT